MTDDLTKNAEFDAPDADVEALDAGYAPLLTNYTLSRVAAADEVDQINPIRREQPDFEVPLSLFMVYMKFDSTAQLIVRQFRFLDYGQAGLTLEQAEEALLLEARAAQPGGAHYVGSNFNNMIWRRPYYLTFVIDNQGWEFYWHESQRHEAFRLLSRKDAPGPIGFTAYVGENHTFSDAKADIPLPSLGDAFRVANAFRRGDGPIDDQALTDKYCFEVYLKAPFKDPVVAGQPTHITVLIDPDGQNQGPRT